MSKSVLLALIVLALGPCACGPSFQAIYEGNVHFEHCYALEENPQLSLPDKAACWRDWSEHYTFGQTRDRVQYAISRYVALTRTTAAPTDEAMMNAAPGESPRTTMIYAPAPSNAFAPPPKVLEPETRTTNSSSRAAETNNNVPYLDAGAPAPVVTVTAPNQSCLEGCAGDYRGCAYTCDGDGGAKSKTCTTCKQKYATCGRGCFK